MNLNRSIIIPSNGNVSHWKNESDLPEQAYVWHHFSQPSEADFRNLPASYGLHPLAIEDCLHDDQIPKMESFSNHTHIIFNSFHPENDDCSTEEINIFIGENYLITSTISEKLTLIFQKVFSHVENDTQGVWRNGPAWLLHLLLDRIVDDKMVALEMLEDEMDLIEEEMLVNVNAFDFARVQKLRRTFLLFRKSLFHEREILNRIIRHDCEFISDKSVYVFRDVFDHVARLFEVAETCRENIKNMVELHLAMANNQMSLTANRTNKTMRRLTFITTIFMPLTLIAGIGGMSEYTAITGSQHMTAAYVALIFLMTLIGILCYRWLSSIDQKEQ